MDKRQMNYKITEYEITKRIQKDRIFENIKAMEKYIELLKEQLRADNIDDFNISFMRSVLGNIDKAYVNYKITDNQLKLINNLMQEEK